MSKTPKKAKAVAIYHVLLLFISAVIITGFQYCPIMLDLPGKIPMSSFFVGMIGGTLNASRTLVKVVRDGKYDEKRILWQVLTPIHSGFLAIVAVIFLKSGFHLAIDSNGQASSISFNNFEFIFVVSFLSGFSTEIFIKKLIGASESLFGEKHLNEKNNYDD